MSPKWSEETTLKFVQLYREHECLWNAFLPAYKDRLQRFAALKIISEEMALPDFGPNEVPKKVKILRSTYYQELLKINKSKMLGDGYVPALRWFNIMHEIIRNLPNKRQSQNTAEFYSEESMIPEENEEDLLSSFTADQLEGANIVVKSEKMCDNGNIDEVPMELRRAGSPRSWRLKRYEARRVASVRRARQASCKRPRNGDDEFDIFGKHVAAQLRKLEEEECVTAQDQIQSVLSQARLRTIQRSSSSSHYQHDGYLSTWSP